MGIKTNALRILDKEKINYKIQTYEVDESDLSGLHVIEQLCLEAKEVYKTLVLHGDKTGYLVACIPVDKELDLKKLAHHSKNKKVEMIHLKDLFSITGYIRGGCSPIGMKKQFPTYIHNTVVELGDVYVSAGKRGLQMRLKPQDLIQIVHGVTEDIVKDG